MQTCRRLLQELHPQHLLATKHLLDFIFDEGSDFKSGPFLFVPAGSIEFIDFQ